MGRQLAEHPCTFASTFESCSFHVKQSKQSARRRIVKTKVAKKNVPCNSRAVYSGGTASFADANGKRQNYGFPTRGTLYFLAAKSTKNSPADAFAYFVRSNVRNGRLRGFASKPAPFFNAPPSCRSFSAASDNADYFAPRSAAMAGFCVSDPAVAPLLTPPQAAKDPGSMPEPSNEGPAKSAGVRRRF